VGALPTDEASLLAGRALYVAHCAVCHSATGAGDDLYAADSGQPLPDLRQHMAPGVHTDGQILAYIRDGISGTSMPGYGLLLSEAELLQLAAYLRTFAQERPVVGVDPGALATEQARPPTPTPIPDVREPLPSLVFVRDNALWGSDGAAAPAPLADLGPGVVVQNPAFAPDGLRVAFVALQLAADGTDAFTSTLFLADRAGGAPRPVWAVSQAYLRHPAWSPDGAALYVTTTRGETAADGTYQQQADVVRVDLATGASAVAISAARDMTFSPDGGQIAYVAMRPDGATAGLMIAAPDGSGPRALVPDGTFEELAAPRFAPDGSSLLFVARGEPLAGQPSGDSPAGAIAAWLGALLAPPAASAHGTPWDVWAVGVDGAGLRRLTAIYEDEPHAVFSPDGREIALLGVGGIYRLDSDGGRLRRVDPLGSYGGLDWAPR